MDQQDALFEVGGVLVVVLDDLRAVLLVVPQHLGVHRVQVAANVLGDEPRPLLVGVEGLVQPVDGAVCTHPHGGVEPQALQEWARQLVVDHDERSVGCARVARLPVCDQTGEVELWLHVLWAPALRVLHASPQRERRAGGGGRAGRVRGARVLR